jgi:hypothetical protein
MKISLSGRQIEIIEVLRLKDAGRNSSAFDSLENEEINLSEIEVLCDLVNAEFMMEGILPNFEPNECGLELEGLLDVINRPRLSANRGDLS